MPRKRAMNGSGIQPRKRKDGRWECRVRTGINPGTGKPIYKSFYGATADECVKKLRKATAAIDGGTYAEPTKMTVGQWLEIWQNEYFGGIKEATVASYQGLIKNYLYPNIGGLKLSSLQPHTIQTMYNRILKAPGRPDGLSAKTLKNLHGVLHKALKLAVKLGYIKTNPAEACELPRVEHSEVAFLENEDIEKLLKAIKGHRYEAVYTVALFTGMRQAELLGLTWDCVDFENGTIKVEKQLQRIKQQSSTFRLTSCKNDRVRRIMPATGVMEILKQQRQKQLENRLKAGEMWQNEWDLVFTNEVGGHLYETTIYKNFKKIVKEIGVPDTRFHDLRHTYSMVSLQNGDDIKTVQNNVGHATASFTLDIYGHASQKMKKDSADRMQSYWEHISAAK